MSLNKHVFVRVYKLCHAHLVYNTNFIVKKNIQALFLMIILYFLLLQGYFENMATKIDIGDM